jgi:hypothetical protein
MLARTPGATTRKRRYRRRLANGVIVIHCEIREAEFAEALMLSKRLSERATLRRDKLANAAEAILQEFLQRWLAHRYEL